MNYALTINADQIITGVHESVTPILADTFSANPELADDTVIIIPAPADYQTHTHILCYDEDGTRKPDLWCIENGYMELPPNKEIINGELVNKEIPAEEAPPAIMAVMREAAEEAARAATNAFDKRFTALKPVISDLLKGREAAVVIGLKDFIMDWKPGPYERGHSVMRNNYPFKVVQTHDSTEQPNWTPEEHQAGFAPWHGTTPETALLWMKPRHAEENYLPGEYMIWDDGKVYLSQRSTNFTPEEYPNDWHVQQADGTFAAIDSGEIVDPEEPDEPIDPEPEPEPEIEELNSNGTARWSLWIDPAGIHAKMYSTGDGVTDENGVRWISNHNWNGVAPADNDWWTKVTE